MTANNLIRIVMRRRNRRAFSIIYFALAIIPLIGFVSLAVDIGRLRLAHTDLSVAADAAARAGASGLYVGATSYVATTQDRAVQFAAANYCLDKGGAGRPGYIPVVIDKDLDLDFLYWNPTQGPKQSITILTGPARQGANAVRVYARRTAARNTPLPLLLAPVFGKPTADTQASAIAFIRGGENAFGFIGLDSVILNSASSDSYDPSLPYASQTPGNEGSIVSNGGIKVDGSSTTIQGDLRPGINGSLILNGSATVSGWEAPLTAKLDPPIPPFNPATTNIKNSSVSASQFDKPGAFSPSNNLTLAAGNYVPDKSGGKKKFLGWSQTSQTTITITGPTQAGQSPTGVWIDGDLSLAGGAKIVVTGKVIFYINGDVKINGGGIVNNGLPSSLEIHVTKAGTSVTLSGNSLLSAHVDAPLSDVTVSGGQAFFGWIIGQKLTATGSSFLHYDGSLGLNNHIYAITLVK